MAHSVNLARWATRSGIHRTILLKSFQFKLPLRTRRNSKQDRDEVIRQNLKLLEASKSLQPIELPKSTESPKSTEPIISKERIETLPNPAYKNAEYPYNSLPDHSCIRLLQLLPGIDDEPLEGQLVFADIHHAPSYEAISYVWGDPNSEIPFQLNDASFPITTNLGIALRQCRHIHTPRLLWVDSICIDQKSNNEKSHQVGLMGIIYQSASQVLISLGEEDEDARAVISMIQMLNESFMLKFGPDSTIRHTRLTGLEVNRSCTLYPWKSWNPFFKNREWFHRVWTVQEIGLAARAIVMCGSIAVQWTAMMNVMVWLLWPAKALKDKLELTTTSRIFWRWVNYAIHSTAENGPTSTTLRSLFSFFPRDQIENVDFLEVLKYSLHVQATHELDHIYGFLGHPAARTTDGELLIQPDYKTATAPEVYTLVTRRLIDTTKSLRVLSLVSHPDGGPSKRLSAWVPWWHLGPTTNPFGLRRSAIFHASGKKLAQVGVSMNPKTVRLRGFMFDTIGWHSATLGKDHFDGELQGDLKLNDCPVIGTWFQACKAKKTVYKREIMNEAVALTFAVVGTSAHEDSVKSIKAAVISSFHVYILLALTKAKHENGHDECRKAIFTSMKKHVFETASSVEKRMTKVAGSADFQRFLRRAKDFSTNRKFFVTDKGYFGLGPRALHENDVLCILYGGQVPYVLREGPAGQYTFIGECYMHGVMDGQALSFLKTGAVKEQWFDLV